MWPSESSSERDVTVAPGTMAAWRRTRSPSRSAAGCSTSATGTSSTGASPATRTASRRSSSTAVRARPMRRGSQMFDPARYRIVQFDQRQCGRSTPHGVGAGRRPADEHDGPPRRRHRAAARRTSASSAGWCGAGRGGRCSASCTPRRTRPASARWCSSASSGRHATTSSGSPARWAGCSRRSGSASATPCRPPTATATWRRRTPGCCRIPTRPSTVRPPRRGASGRTPTWRPCPGTPTTTRFDDAGVPPLLRPPRHPLLEQRLLRRGRPGAARRASPRRHPDRHDQRAARHQRPARTPRGSWPRRCPTPS